MKFVKPFSSLSVKGTLKEQWDASLRDPGFYLLLLFVFMFLIVIISISNDEKDIKVINERKVIDKPVVDDGYTIISVTKTKYRTPANYIIWEYCYKGVKYFYIDGRYKGSSAPLIDKETLKPMICEENE